MSGVAQDIRYALRSLGRAPGFTLVALATLALGIGGTTAIFSVVDGILLRALPYPDPARIVMVTRDPGSLERATLSAADFLDYQRDSRSFAALAGFREDIVDLTGSGEPVRVSALETTAGFFDVFGLPPLAGRVYSSATDRPGGPRVVVVSEGMWRQQLGADPEAVGRTIRLNGIPFTVIGVVPDTIATPPQEIDIFVLAASDVPTSPVPIDGDARASREVQYFHAIGRLAAGVTLADANADLGRIGERLAREFPDTNDRESAAVVPYQDSLVGDVRPALLVLLAAVAFVLLIACANIAALLLARGAARRRELAVRGALGASRGQLVRQLLIESLVLAIAGGLLGLMVSFWGLSALVALAPESIPRLQDVRIDPRVMAFAATASVLVGLAFGVVPALQGSRAHVVDALKDGGRTGTSRTGAQKTLVVAEMALALVLLIGAGLMLTSFVRLRAVDTGFATNHLVSVWVALPQARYDSPAQARFYSELLERVQTNAVTFRSALVFPPPFSGGNASGAYLVEGRRAEPRVDQPVAQLSSVSPGYFQTLGIPLLRGRDVSARDTTDAPQVAVVNQVLAEREWPGEDPIGRRIALGGDPADPDSWMTVVGVVGNSKRSDLQRPTSPAIYLPHTTFTLPFMALLVRSEAGDAAVLGAVRDAARSLDPDLPIPEARSVEQLLERTTGQPRFRALLTGAFAAVALLLAAVGLYGLVSYTVAERVPEIGVRLALGASPAQMMRLVIGQGLGLAGAGIALGLAGAVAATQLIAGLLYSVSTTEPVIYASLALLLLGVAALASYVPARRAMRVDPVTALRTE